MTETPWQVRYTRWWHMREARYHANCKGTRLYDRKWHLGQMRDAVRVAREARGHWLRTGVFTPQWRGQQEAEDLMAGRVAYPEPIEGSCADDIREGERR